jgi:hypothetical protein
MSSSRAGPVFSRSGVKSMMTVTYFSPRRVCRQTCSSTPIADTPSNRRGSSINRRLPSPRTASFAVCQDTPSPAATLGHGEVVDHDSLQPPTGARSGRSSPAAGRPGGCPAAIPAGIPGAGTGAPAPAGSWADDRTAHARNGESRCPAACLPPRKIVTTRPARRHGIRSPRASHPDVVR